MKPSFHVSMLYFQNSLCESQGQGPILHSALTVFRSRLGTHSNLRTQDWLHKDAFFPIWWELSLKFFPPFFFSIRKTFISGNKKICGKKKPLAHRGCSNKRKKNILSAWYTFFFRRRLYLLGKLWQACSDWEEAYFWRIQCLGQWKEWPATVASLDPCWQALPGGGPGSLHRKVHMLSLGLRHSPFLWQLWPMGVTHWWQAVCLIALLCS